MRNIVRSSIAILLFLGVWELFGRSGFVHISLFPPPSYVILALVEMARSGELVRDIGVSLWRAIAGWTLGSLIGVIVGLITGRMRIVSDYLSPVIQLFRPLPPVAIIPLIIVWFGIGEISKLFSIAFAVFFPVWINAHVGAQRIPKTFIWSAQSLNASRITIFWKVIFPGSIPFIVAGLRTGVAMAFVMVFVSELAGASSGVGYQISVSHLAYRVDRMMGALVVLAMLGAVSDIILSKLLARKFPWIHYSDQK
jgi:ABC-type nitrate/sulfonate/bicarbonate transport system permease component